MLGKHCSFTESETLLTLVTWLQLTSILFKSLALVNTERKPMSAVENSAVIIAIHQVLQSLPAP
jgi:hypothetical protein